MNVKRAYENIHAVTNPKELRQLSFISIRKELEALREEEERHRIEANKSIIKKKIVEKPKILENFVPFFNERDGVGRLINQKTKKKPKINPLDSEEAKKPTLVSLIGETLTDSRTIIEQDDLYESSHRAPRPKENESPRLSPRKASMTKNNFNSAYQKQRLKAMIGGDPPASTGRGVGDNIYVSENSSPLKRSDGELIMTSLRSTDSNNNQHASQAQLKGVVAHTQSNSPNMSRFKVNLQKSVLQLNYTLYSYGKKTATGPFFEENITSTNSTKSLSAFHTFYEFMPGSRDSRNQHFTRYLLKSRKDRFGKASASPKSHPSPCFLSPARVSFFEEAESKEAPGAGMYDVSHKLVHESPKNVIFPKERREKAEKNIKKLEFLNVGQSFDKLYKKHTSGLDFAKAPLRSINPYNDEHNYSKKLAEDMDIDEQERQYEFQHYMQTKYGATIKVNPTFKIKSEHLPLAKDGYIMKRVKVMEKNGLDPKKFWQESNFEIKRGLLP
eukprot:TRINITY_DN206_c0_g2_i2.p1 TRINITY_DN206_c0_g2~~TRINITY_DN206_c0_g2_i2.p1  ORF type:complete len:500 (-),score=81.64 TRINITY_DN206_c0_g2_i2:47-1546(-)